MNKRTAMQWIVEEVDGLVASGVLTAESGEAVRRHYAAQLAREESGGRVVILSVLGAALIGAGVILLIAHNWENLGRPVRTALSLLPLLVSGAISLFALLKRPGSGAWREAAGVGQSAGVAASIALVSQTYHISGELSDFLCTWLLLTLPLPYLLGAVMPALIYLGGIAVWAGSLQNGGPSGAFWLFWAAMLPFCASVVRRDRLGRTAAWLTAFAGLSALFGLGFEYGHAEKSYWIAGFGGFLGFLYTAGVCGFPERRYHPVRAMGALGIAIFTVVISFKGVWPDTYYWQEPRLENLLAVIFTLGALALGARAFVGNLNLNGMAAVFPLVPVIGYGLAASAGNATAAIWVNLYGFALALFTAFRGLRQRAVPTLNGGLLLLAALIVCRFADSEFGLVERGLAFILLGALVLGANLWMLTTKKEAAR